MKRRFLSALLALCMCLTMLPTAAWAADEDVKSGDWTYSLQNGQATIKGYSGNDTEVVIPDTIDNYPVTKVYTLTENNAGAPFTSISVPASVTEFEFLAFQNMRQLETVTFAEESKLTKFPIGAFQNCTSLKNVNIPAGVTVLPDRAFYGCTSLQSISIPATVTQFNAETFQGASSLTNVHFESGSQLTSIGSGAFKNCTSLKTIEIPDTVSSFGAQVFENCFALESVQLPDSAAVLSTQMFLLCTSLTSIELPEGLTTVGKEAFNGCSDLSSVSFPSTLRTIEDMAFLETALTTVHIPDNVQSIGNSAFNNIGTLTDVYLPNSASTPTMGTGTSAYTFYNDITPSALTIHVYAGSAGETWAKAQQNQLKFNIAYHEGEKITVNLNDEAHTPVTGSFTVHWFVDGVSAGTGTSCTIPAEAKTCSFLIALGADLAKEYYPPAEQSVTLTGEEQTISVQLSKITSLPVSGSVADSSGKSVTGATVTFYPASEDRDTGVSVSTGNDGVFSATIDNVATTYTVSAEGYLSQTGTAIATVHAGESLDLGRIILKPLPESRVKLTLKQRSAVPAGGTPAETQLSDYSGHTFTVTKNGETVESRLQGQYLYFPSGVSAGDGLTISLDNGLDTKAVTLNDNGYDEAVLSFAEKGGIEVSLTGAGPATVLLFDNENGLIEDTTAAGTYRNPALDDGSYTLILLQKNDLVRSADSPTTLTALGLTPGRDYVLLDGLQVQRGVVTTQSVQVPQLDESKFSFVDKSGTRVSMDATSAPVGKLILLNIAYKLREGVTGVQNIQVTLPAGMTMQGAPAVDGVVSSNYTSSGNAVTIPVTGDSGTIRFYVAASEAGTYSLTPVLTLQSGSQPIGTVTTEAVAATISVPSKTSNQMVGVSGTALPNSVVTVYDNGKEAATATANSAGNWYASIALTAPSGYSFHEIYALVASGGPAYKTEHVSCLYSKAAVDVSKVYMYNTVSGAEQCSVFDYSNPGSSSAYYTLEEQSFTFKIEFAGSDTARLENVRLNVFTRDGEMYSYETTKTADGVYAAAVSGIVPVNVGVSYACKPQEVNYDYNGLTDDQYDAQVKAYLEQDEVSDLVDLLEVKSVEDVDEQTFRITYGAADSTEADETWFDIDFSVLPYEETAATLQTKNFKQNSDNTYELAVISNEILEYTYVNTGEQTAVSISLPWDMTPTPETRSEFSALSRSSADVRRTLGVKMFYELAEKAGLPYYSEFVAMLDLNDLIAFLVKQRMEVSDEISALLDMLDQVSAATCEDGTPKISEEDYEACQAEIYGIYNVEQQAYDGLNAALDRYGQRIGNSLLFSTATLGMGKLVAKGIAQLGKVPTHGLIVAGEQLINPVLTAAQVQKLQHWANIGPDVAEKLYTHIDSVLDATSDNLTGYALPDVSQGDGIWDWLDIYSTPYYNAIVNQYETIRYANIETARNHIYQSINPCTDDPEPEQEKSPCPDTVPIEDPSGQVYEAVPSNLLSGVTATIVTKDGANTENWEAADFNQENPQTTGADGSFYWNVPQGEYQVIFRKDGYQDAATDWLTVPPPHLGLMIPMVSTESPVVSQVQAYTDRAEVTFSQYMDMDSVEKAVTLSLGAEEIPVTVEPLDAQYAADGQTQYATRFALIPASGKLEAPVVIHISTSAKNYHQTAMASNYTSDPLTPEIRPTGLTAPSTFAVGLNQTDVLTVTLQSGAGRELVAESGSSLFSIKQTQVTTNAQGAAQFTLTGNLPGTAQLRIFDPVSGLEETVQIEVKTAVIQPVTVKLADGTELTADTAIPKGSRITLSTESGAQIRYTLDGTCPKQTNALVYQDPITVTADTTLRAVAVKNGEYSNTIRMVLTVTDSEPSDPSGSGGGGGGGGAATYPVSTPSGVPNGTISVSPNSAAKDEKVTITVKPDDGYTLDTLTVTDANGNAVSLTRVSDTQYTFSMPASKVSVKATFKAESSPLPFTDVGTGDWFYEAVKYAYDNGIMNGAGNNLFAPTANLTRGQICQVLYNLEGTPAAGSGAFTDVADGQWYADAVNWAAANDIVDGYGNGKFGPEDDITREQMAQILCNYAAFKDCDVSVQGDLATFNDGAKTSDWALSAMKWAVGTGLLQGHNGNLNPTGTATRAEVAQILMIFCENIKK